MRLRLFGAALAVRVFDQHRLETPVQERHLDEMLPSAAEFEQIKAHGEGPLVAAIAWAGLDGSLLMATRTLLGPFKAVREVAGMPSEDFWASLRQEVGFVTTSVNTETQEEQEVVTTRKLNPLELSQVGALRRICRQLMELPPDAEGRAAPQGGSGERGGRSRRRRRRSSTPSSSTAARLRRRRSTAMSMGRTDGNVTPRQPIEGQRDVSRAPEGCSADIGGQASGQGTWSSTGRRTARTRRTPSAASRRPTWPARPRC